MSQTFRSNQIVVNLTQTEVATLLTALRQGWIMHGKTNDNLQQKLHDALILAGRDPQKFGVDGDRSQGGSRDK